MADSGWGPKIDVFAIGCLCFELFCGIPMLPWTNSTREYLFSVEKTIGRFGILQAEDISKIHPSMFVTKSRIPRVKSAGMNSNARQRLLKYIAEVKWQKVRFCHPRLGVTNNSTTLETHKQAGCQRFHLNMHRNRPPSSTFHWICHKTSNLLRLLQTQTRLVYCINPK